MQALIGVGLIGSGFALLGPKGFEFALLILGLTAVFSALCNVATDGFAILSMNDDQRGEFAGLMSTCSRIGRLLTISLLPLIVGLLSKQGIETVQGWAYVLAAVGFMYTALICWGRMIYPRPELDVERTSSSSDNRSNWGRVGSLLFAGVPAYQLFSFTVKLLDAFIGKMLAKPEGVDAATLKLETLLKIDGPWAIGYLAVFAVGLAWAWRVFPKSDMARAMGGYITQPGFGAILGFIVFYRLGEVMISKLTPLFLKGSPLEGGLGIQNDELGILNLLGGPAGLLVGGIAGGYCVHRWGLKKLMLPLALAMHIPNLLYYLICANPDLIQAATVTINSISVKVPLLIVLFVDQFGYGFGFTGFMVYLIWVAQRSAFQTTYYAIGTGLSALVINLMGPVAGVLRTSLGFSGAFLVVLGLAVPGIWALYRAPLDDSHQEIKVEVE